MDSKTNTKKPTYPGLGIDFITHEISEDGQSLISHTNFDCYREPYEQGIFRGTRMVYQIMAALEKMPDNGDPTGLARHVIEEAAELSNSEDREKAHSLRGVAVGVLMGFDELIVDIARSGNWRASMVKSLNSELDYLKVEHDHHAEEAMAFMARLGADCALSAGGTSDSLVSVSPTNAEAARISPEAIAALESMARQAASLADLCNGEGMVVDVLDHAQSLYLEAVNATESDVRLSILCSAESFAASAWAIARCQAIDDGKAFSPHVEVLKTFKEMADEIANQFDGGGIYHPDTTPVVIAPKKAKANAQKAVAA